METASRLAETIREFVRTSPDNSLRNETGEKARQEPLVGFAGGTPVTKERFGFESQGCGLSRMGVPCESRIPVKA